MHFEILVEDASGKKLLDAILPKIFTNDYSGHTWRTISYKGVGRIPPNLRQLPNPANRFLLDQLPRLLSGYGKTYPNGAHRTSIVVVLDCDRFDCKSLLAEMLELLNSCNPKPRTMFRIAIEECEAWILGDIGALKSMYPKAKTSALDTYTQDTICGTWEKLADVIYPGGSAVLSKRPYYEIGKAKCEWAERIGPAINVETNKSISFCKFRDGIREMAIT